MMNEQNLKSFQPGQSGNPDGRPLGAKDGLRVRLIRKLDKEVPESLIEYLKSKGIELEDRANAELIVEVMIRAAIKGDVSIIKMIFDQTEIPIPREDKLDHRGRITHQHEGVSATAGRLAEFARKRAEERSKEPLQN